MIGLIFLGCLSLPGSAGGDVITELNDRARIAFLPQNQGVAVMQMAYVHAAIYDAVNAIDGRYTVYAVKPANVPSGSSKEAAAIAAAYTVLIGRLPLQAASLTGDYNAMLAAIPDSPGKANGIAIGVEVGNGILALRAGDGLDAPAPPYVFGTGPGTYQKIPIFQPRPDPINQTLATMRPFTILSPSQFRAKGPPSLTSEEWAEDYNEVKSLGAKDSTTRTPEQTQLGISYTENVVTYYTRIFRIVSAARNLSLEDNARFFAMLHLAYADALIAVFESKYHFNFWRPYTAIHAADTDGNPMTEPDPNWAPLVVTPAHPEYPAAHGVASGSIAEILRSFFRTKKITISFTPAAPGYTGGPITLDSTDDMVKQVIDGRIFGGMHYRISGRHGTIMGRKVSKWLVKHYFRPLEDSEGEGAGYGEPEFLRGDSNANWEVDLSDVIYTLEYLFLATGGKPDCSSALDANDDREIDISDALYTLGFLFIGGPAPLDPFPETGADPTADGLGCEEEVF